MLQVITIQLQAIVNNHCILGGTGTQDDFF